MKAQTSPECFDACRSADNCKGENYQAAVILFQPMCASFATKFEDCCEGIIWNIKLNEISSQIFPIMWLIGKWYDSTKYFWVALGYDVPIDSKENRVARDRKSTTHNDVKADISINDGKIFSISFLSKTTFILFQLLI